MQVLSEAEGLVLRERRVSPERSRRTPGCIKKSVIFVKMQVLSEAEGLERLREHNTGKGCKYTKYRYPVKLVYLEKYANISLAMKREKQIKGWNREKKMELIESKSHL